MSELNLPACPMCRAPGALKPHTQSLEGRTYTWYECPACGSVLLSVGDGRWAYQKIGPSDQAHLLKLPLTAAELYTLLAPPAPRAGRGAPPPLPEPEPPAPRPAVERAEPPPAAPAATRAVDLREELAARQAEPPPAAPAATPAVDLREELAAQPRAPGAAADTARQPGPPLFWWGVVGLVLCLILAVVALVAIEVLGGRGGETPVPTAITFGAAMQATPAAAVPEATPVPTLTADPSAGGPALSLPTRATASPTEVLDSLGAVEAKMAEIVGLEHVGSIRRVPMPRNNLESYMERELDTAYPPAQLEADVALWTAVGMLPGDYDLRTALVAAYVDRQAGLYEPPDKAIYLANFILPDAPDLFLRLAFAGGYVSALQDHAFDLGTFLRGGRLGDDEGLARRAVVEGSAQVAIGHYVDTLALTPEQMVDVVGRHVRGDMQPHFAGAVPAVVAGTALFPWDHGPEFVAALYGQGGWAAVNAAFARPPRSTEHILHPDRYLAGDEPRVVALPDLGAALGADWSPVAGGTLGEFVLGYYLALGWPDSPALPLPPEEALAAAAGWGGDRYALYGRGEARVVVLATTWDTPADREEFVAAAGRVASEEYGRPARDGDEAAARWWDGPSVAAVLTWGDDTALLVVGPDRETVAAALQGLGSE